MVISGYMVFCLCLVFIYLMGLYSYLQHPTETLNTCQMTYMFEYPQYLKIPIRDEVKYGLYVYGEGQMMDDYRRSRFTGLPVLFLPGNRGSHRQVRSLASVALRKFLDDYNAGNHFDFFTIDFYEEMTGLNGVFLRDQVLFAQRALDRILGLYPAKRTIVLIGHSMGGLVARYLAQMNEDKYRISIVITLATPNRHPVVLFDWYLWDFMQKLKNLNRTVLISVSGGYGDRVVPPILTHNTGNTLNIITTTVPFGWLETDHLSIVWCKQIVFAVVRSLFDAIDLRTRQITTDVDALRHIFQHHFISHNGVKNALWSPPVQFVKLLPLGDWIEKLPRQYTVSHTRSVNTTKWYMVPVVPNRNHEILTVFALNLETVFWVYACGAHIPHDTSRICDEGVHLTQFTKVVPSVRHKRRMVIVNLHDLKRQYPNVTHVACQLQPSDEPVTLQFDVYNGLGDRNRTVNELPQWWQSKSVILIDMTAPQALIYTLQFPTIQNLLQTYHLYVDSTLKCQSTALVLTPWANHQQYHHHFKSNTGPLLMRLYVPKPHANDTLPLTVQLHLDPECRYTVSIKASFLGQIAQMARHYSPFLLANMAAVLLMALREQFKQLVPPMRTIDLFTALCSGTKPYYILTGVKLVSRAVTSVKLLPTPDWLLQFTLDGPNTDFLLLPLLLYLCSVGLVWLFGVMVGAAIFLYETTLHKNCLRFLSKIASISVIWSEYVLKAVEKLPIVIVGLLLYLNVFCGALSLCLGTVFYFMKITRLAQDLVEDRMWSFLRRLLRRIRQENDNNMTLDVNPLQTATFFHFTIFLIWFLLMVLNLPTALIWAHNYRYSRILHVDPSRVVGIVMSLCAGPLWQMETPKIYRKGYDSLGDILMLAAAICLIYGQFSLYRLNYILVTVIVIVTVHQLFVGDRDGATTSSSTNATTENDEKQHWNEIKAKIE